MDFPEIERNERRARGPSRYELALIAKCPAAPGDFSALVDSHRSHLYQLPRDWLRYLETLIARALDQGAARALTGSERAGLASLLLTWIVRRPMHARAGDFDRLVVPADLEIVLREIRRAEKSIGDRMHGVFSGGPIFDDPLDEMPLRALCHEIWARALVEEPPEPHAGASRRHRGDQQ